MNENFDFIEDTVERIIVKSLYAHLEGFIALEERIKVYGDAGEYTFDLLRRYVNEGKTPSTASAQIAKGNSRELYGAMVDQQRTGYAVQALADLYRELYPNSPLIPLMGSNDSPLGAKITFIQQRIRDGKEIVVDYLSIREDLVDKLSKGEHPSV